MSENFDNFQKKFKIPDLNIYQSHYWVWSVRPTHSTVGSSVLSLRRPAEKFSDITKEESIDFGSMIGIIEKTLKQSFNYDRMNYLMLMMVDFQVHFHVIPRYSHSIDFAGTTWIDKGWPALPDLTAPTYDNKILIQIKEKLITDLQINP